MRGSANHFPHDHYLRFGSVKLHQIEGLVIISCLQCLEFVKSLQEVMYHMMQYLTKTLGIEPMAIFTDHQLIGKKKNFGDHISNEHKKMYHL